MLSSSHSFSLPALLMAIVIAAMSSVVCAQPSTAAATVEQEGTVSVRDGREINFRFGLGLEYQIESDVDGGGDFSLTRLFSGLGIGTKLSNDLQLDLRMGYGLDWYDFGGDSLGLGGVEPWDDIHQVGGSAILTYSLSSQWSVFGGPTILFSRESGASWSSSVTAGGVGGAVYHYSPQLSIGGGLGILSQLEDDVRLYPILIINWHVANDWKVATQPTVFATGRTGVELVWAPGSTGAATRGGWEFAVGLADSFSRFRLDNDGPAPDGVGENSSLPLWLRASTSVGNNLRLDLFAGLNLSGELRIEDEDGNRIAAEDYDPAPFFGLVGSVRF